MEVTDEVVAGFAAGVINDHVLSSPEGCCPKCCAPCGALAWLRDNRRDELDNAITVWLGTDWDWQINGRVNWDKLNRRLGCRAKPPCWEDDAYRQAAKNC